ncbi:unnamed protein product [Lymnaea stagnalis]|uniref:Coiled-coil domain-containing protein 15 n=1 Tax=Lymnaea stagnalis TaxID=6523 RepID=A0AAV2HYC0_LYMST
MATKQPRYRSSAFKTHKAKQNMHSVISSDVMGNRNVEIVPVGAWVEPADSDLQPSAVLAAQYEEEKLSRLKEEKENRLRNFQQEVKKRLCVANRLRRQQQIQEAEQAFDLERKVVQQSCLTADSSRRDTSIQRQDLDAAISKRLLERYGEDVTSWDRKITHNLKRQTEESHQVTDKARQQLISKKITHQSDDQQDPSISRKVKYDDLLVTVKKHKLQWYGHVTRKQGLAKEILLGTTRGGRRRGSQRKRKRWEDNIKDVEEENYCEDNSNEADTKQGRVCFTDIKSVVQRRRKGSGDGNSGRPSSARLNAILNNDVECGILARQRKQQAALSRRIFMDREREAVRENIRREKHRKKIISLKKEKEEYRQELEELAHLKSGEITDNTERDTAEEIKLREELEELHIHEMVERRKEELRRAREMERYLDALKHSLLEKVKRQNLQLPALCACGDTVWDTHPDTCANNCFFYKNQRAYARALQSLLTSAEVK